MKFIVFALLLAGLYTLSLLFLTDSVLGSVEATQSHYTHVSATADKWSQGSTGTSFVLNR